MAFHFHYPLLLAVILMSSFALPDIATAECDYPCTYVYDDDDYDADFYTYGFVTEPEYGVEVEQEIYAPPESYSYYGPGDGLYLGPPYYRIERYGSYSVERVYGGQVAGYRGYRFEPWTDEWYDYCRSRYRSFDPASGTYQPYHGPRRLCR